MSPVRMIPEEEAVGMVKEIYDEIKKRKLERVSQGS